MDGTLQTADGVPAVPQCCLAAVGAGAAARCQRRRTADGRSGADRVCALAVVGTWLDRGAEQAGRRRARRCTADRAAEIRDCPDHAASKQRDDLRAMVGGTRRRTDRKSVVQGKRVSALVALGGRRTIKKKKT